jgi:hypothetical protein
LARIDGVVKRCVSGRWIAAPQPVQAPAAAVPDATPVGASTPDASPQGCQDDQGLAYSHGSLARIKGVVKTCQNGKWVGTGDGL